MSSWHNERAVYWLRQAGVWLGRVPSGVWRFCIQFLLVLWLSYTLAQLVWLLVPAPAVPAAQVAPNAIVSERSGGTARAVDIDALSSLTLFGEASESEVAELPGEEEPVSGPSIEDQAVDTELKLVLRGIMGSNEEQAARAIIANGNQQDLYAPGDTLPVRGRGEVTLEKVLPLRVILDNAGRYESLWLYTDDDWSSNLASSQPIPDTPSRSWDGDEADLYDSPAETLPDEADAGELEEAAEDVGERLGSSSLSDVVSMSIYREDGQIVGYRIRPGRERELFDALGLQTNDIVKAVNGVALTSPQRVMELYREMGDARSASLLIDRDGQELNVDIDLE